MPFDDLTAFLQAAADHDELLRVAQQVDADCEIGTLTQHIFQKSRPQSPAILFENVTGTSIPVVTNLLGNRDRFLRCLAANEVTEVVDRLRDYLNPMPAGRDWTSGIVAPRGEGRRLAARVIRRGSSQQILNLGKDVQLNELPVPRLCQQESHPTLTSGLMVSGAGPGETLLERVCLRVLDSQSCAILWDPRQQSYRRWKAFQRQNRQFPVAVSFGGDPLLRYVASLPLPTGTDPWWLTGVFRNESLNLVRARTVELDVPADAEFILEGYLDPEPESNIGDGADATALEPVQIANRWGQIESVARQTRLRISALTHRANPMLPVLVSGDHFHEDFVTSELTEQLALASLRLTCPGIRDICLPEFGAHGQAVYVQLEEFDEFDLRQSIFAVCSQPLLADAHLIVIVGPNVTMRGPSDVLREVCRRGCLVSLGVRGEGERIVIDATSIIRGAGATAAFDSHFLDQIRERLQNPDWLR